jgi:hypothetical protein
VLAQSDRSNRALETGLSLAARTAGDPQRRAQAARSLLAIKKTRASLAEAQEAVLAVLLEDRGLSPLVFAAEDFLACLLLADSLPPASAERWFPTTVKRMVFGQDYDGGLRTDVHIDCTWNCRCERYLFKGAGTRQLTRAATGMKRGREEARRGAAGKGGEPSVDRQYCSDYRSYFSRERVFCTAVAVAAILADTPYKPAMFKNPPDAANKPK